MTSLTGLAVHSGLFIGRAKLIQSPSAQIPSRRISTTEVNTEIAALQESLNFSETCASEVLSLPMFPELTPEEIRQIADVVNNVR